MGKETASGLKVPYEITDLTAVPGNTCPCGTSHRAFLREDNQACTLHLVDISQDARPHYHKRLTEVYYFLSGRGHIELDGVRHPAKPGTAVLIRPGTKHRAIAGGEPMQILNIVMPRFDPNDEWFD
jgi:mannose-6-phosphate isomerase-like protein (cupin superfamily)